MATITVDPSTRHPDYEKHLKSLKVCYDAFAGDVRNEVYVPALTGQTKSEYEGYVTRPFYLNATERTVQSIIGVTLREKPVVSGPEPRVFGSASFNGMVQDQVMDLMLGARLLIVLDIDDAGQPYLNYYPAQNIINWTDDFVMLESTTLERSASNPYKLVPVTKWKELYLDANGNHTARYWTKQGSGKFTSSDPVTMMVRGQPVQGLMVWWVTPYDNTSLLYTPPVRSIAELNVAHFRLSCDHYNGLHFLGVPTLYAQGELLRNEDGSINQTITLGSTTTAPHFAQGGSLAFAEYNGTGLGSIHEEKDRVEELMSQYGARLVSPKAGVESAEAVTIRATAENSILETFISALETGLNGALEQYGLITGSPVSVQFNRNFTEPTHTEPAVTTETA